MSLMRSCCAPGAVGFGGEATDGGAMVLDGWVVAGVGWAAVVDLGRRCWRGVVLVAWGAGKGEEAPSSSWVCHVDEGKATFGTVAPAVAHVGHVQEVVAACRLPARSGWVSPNGFLECCVHVKCAHALKPKQCALSEAHKPGPSCYLEYAHQHPTKTVHIILEVSRPPHPQNSRAQESKSVHPTISLAGESCGSLATVKAHLGKTLQLECTAACTPAYPHNALPDSNKVHPMMGKDACESPGLCS
eukprot:1158428-Pelagomonas_calceolata.AAC.3